MQSLDFLYKYAVWHSASMHGGGYNMIHETQERDITLVCLSMGMGFQKGFWLLACFHPIIITLYQHFQCPQWVSLVWNHDKRKWQKCGKSLHFLQRAEVIIVTTNMTKKKRQDVSNMKQLLKSIETVSRMDNFRLNLKNKHSRKTLNVLTFLYGWFPGQVGYS